MYGSWDLERDRQNFVILNRFLHFYVVDAENQNFEKMKKPWRLDHFRQVYYNWQSYDAWFLRYKEWRREISTIYSPNNPKNQNFEKMKKNTWQYHFTQLYQKSWSYAIVFLRYHAWQM